GARRVRARARGRADLLRGRGRAVLPRPAGADARRRLRGGPREARGAAARRRPARRPLPRVARHAARRRRDRARAPARAAPLPPRAHPHARRASRRRVRGPRGGSRRAVVGVQLLPRQPAQPGRPEHRRANERLRDDPPGSARGLSRASHRALAEGAPLRAERACGRGGDPARVHPAGRAQRGDRRDGRGDDPRRGGVARGVRARAAARPGRGPRARARHRPRPRDAAHRRPRCGAARQRGRRPGRGRDLVRRPVGAADAGPGGPERLVRHRPDMAGVRDHLLRRPRPLPRLRRRRPCPLRPAAHRARAHRRAARSRVTRYRWAVLGAGTFAQTTYSAIWYGVAVAAPALRREYGLTLTQTGLLLSLSSLGSLVSLIPWGIATDRVGERAVLVLGLSTCGCALVGVAFAHGFAALALLLLAAGATGAGIQSASGRAVMHWFPAGERGLALGLRQTAVPVSGFLVSLGLPPIEHAGGVAWAFAAMGIACLAGAAVGGLVVREGPGRAEASAAPAVSPLRDARLWRLSVASTLVIAPQMCVVGFAVVFLHDRRDLTTSSAAAILAVMQLLAI